MFLVKCGYHGNALSYPSYITFMHIYTSISSIHASLKKFHKTMNEELSAQELANGRTPYHNTTLRAYNKVIIVIWPLFRNMTANQKSLNQIEIFWYQFTPRKLLYLMISVNLVKFCPHWLSGFFGPLCTVRPTKKETHKSS